MYWHDEVYSSWRIMGYTGTEITDSLFSGEVIDRETLLFSQRFNPNKTLKDTLDSLAVDDPQHPPLYYLMARFWVQLFGDQIRIIRTLSVGISLVVFPATYWLCLELFPQSLTGGIMIALVAISPVHLLFAQEAREYVLWTVITLLCSAALLRGIRITNKAGTSWRKIWWSWVIYSLFLCLGFYTFLLTGFVAMGHGIYVGVIEKFRVSPVIKFYGISLIFALIGFAPWVGILIENYDQVQLTTGWTQNIQVSTGELVKIWSLNLVRIFWDLPRQNNTLFFQIFSVISIFLFGWSFVLIFRSRKFLENWVFILTLIGSNFLSLAIPDLVLGGIRSVSMRYLIPAILGVQLAVANGLADMVIYPSVIYQKVGRFLTGFILITGVISCGLISQSDTAWTKVVSDQLPQVAHLINDYEQPLVISNNQGINQGNIVSLSYLLETDVKFQLFLESQIPQIDQSFKTIFFFSLADDLRERIEVQYQWQSELVFADEFVTLRRVVF